MFKQWKQTFPLWASNKDICCLQLSCKYILHGRIPKAQARCATVPSGRQSPSGGLSRTMIESAATPSPTHAHTPSHPCTHTPTQPQTHDRWPIGEDDGGNFVMIVDAHAALVTRRVEVHCGSGTLRFFVRIHAEIEMRMVEHSQAINWL